MKARIKTGVSIPETRGKAKEFERLDFIGVATKSDDGTLAGDCVVISADRWRTLYRAWQYAQRTTGKRFAGRTIGKKYYVWRIA